MKTSPSWRASDAIPSKTEPVPFSVPFTVPHEKSNKVNINKVTKLIFISSHIFDYWYNLDTVNTKLYQFIKFNNEKQVTKWNQLVDMYSYLNYKNDLLYFQNKV